ncbi:MAG: acyltransferase family protein [Erythrobacter sp.]
MGVTQTGGREAEAQRVIPYRPEIDGLRAVAIVPVVLYHAQYHTGLVWLPGGFTGVDVFFVISGYLITAIIASQLAQGTFSLPRFWERRVRRIVPALAAMLIATACAGWIIMTPQDFTQLSKALAASSVFVSNILFARGTDYFSTDAGYDPLIHTWTLGVEEQFYILFPLLVLLVWRVKPAALLPAIAGVGVFSFLLAVGTATLWPLASFYLMPTRLWELAFGATCALLPAAFPALARIGRRFREWAAFVGLAAIGAGLFLINSENSATPAWLLLPTLGSGAVILFAEPKGWVTQTLSLRPLVVCGKISFGTYLWHQPILSFQRYIWFGEVPIVLLIAGLVASFAMGAASYVWIERPIRRKRTFNRSGTLIAASVMALGLPVGIGLSAYAGALLPHSGQEAQTLAGLKPANASAQRIIPEGSAPPFVLYGDSHAAQYYDAFTARFGQGDLGGALLARSGCLSAVGIVSQPSSASSAHACTQHSAALTSLVQERSIPVVIWAQRWERLLFTPGSDEPLGLTTKDAQSNLIKAMEETARALPDDVRIVIMGNSPTAWAAGEKMEEGWLRCRRWINTTCPSEYPAHLAEGRGVNEALKYLAERNPRFDYVDVQEPLCPEGRCLLIQEGKLNYWHGSHMTLSAATRVVNTIDPELIVP